MMRVINAMQKAARGKDIEIVNYNYARFVFDPGELDKLDKIGVDLIDDFIKSIDTNGIKERLGIDVSAEKTGNKDNVIIVSGIGALYESLPDDFMTLLDLPRILRENVESSVEQSIAPPVMRSAATILEDESENLNEDSRAGEITVESIISKIVKSTGEKRADIEDEVKKERDKRGGLITSVGAAFIIAGRHGVDIDIEIPAEKKTPETKIVTKPRKVKKKAPALKQDDASEGAKYLKEYMDKEAFGERDDLIKKLMNEKNMSKQDAESAYNEMIRSFPSIKEEDGMVYKE